VRGALVSVLIAATPEEAAALVLANGIEVRAEAAIEVDQATCGAHGRGLITDRAFFSLFTDARVAAVDVSDYEGADYVADLNRPFPSTLTAVADFVFNGSCMDNFFDPAAALRNMTRTLRSGGRIVHLEHGSPVQNAYVMYSPAFFFDYHAANRFTDCKVYAALFDDMLDPWQVFLWEPYYVDVSGWKLSDQMHPGWKHLLNVVIAEKGEESTSDESPIQGFYRQVHGSPDDQFLELMLRFRSSSRRPAIFPGHDDEAPGAGGFTYCGLLEDPALAKIKAAMPRLLQARTLTGERKFREALQHFTEAIELCPSIGQPGVIFSERAEVYDALGEFALAMADYEHAIRLDPHPAFVQRRNDLAPRLSNEPARQTPDGS
jgi:SAM-dependent methyltransferase